MQIIPFLWQVCLIIQLKHTLMFWLRWATKVAIAEQMEDPKQAVGVVKREVVQVITPEITVVDSSKPDSANNFLVAIDKVGSRFESFLYGCVNG